MFERFTDPARRVVVFAQDEARRLNHVHIGPEHLLLGVVREGKDAGARALASFGLTLDDTRRRVEADLPRGVQGPGSHIPFTEPAKQVLEQSLHTALQLKHKRIGTEHIVLGLAHDDAGIAAHVLTQAAGDLDHVRGEVMRQLEKK
jgi:ATP-dependent Clp protease ATP-binding subunit ClpC